MQDCMLYHLKENSEHGFDALILLCGAQASPSSPAGHVCHSFAISSNCGAGSSATPCGFVKSFHISFTSIVLFTPLSTLPFRVQLVSGSFLKSFHKGIGETD